MRLSVTKSLREAWLTEAQAIAIYRAEIQVLKHTAWTAGRKKTLTLCREILAEEEEHQTWVETSYPNEFATPCSASLHRLAGFILGSVLAFCPPRLSWRLHEWAELQAADAYTTVTQKIKDPVIRERLLKASEQERNHSLRFREVRNG